MSGADAEPTGRDRAAGRGRGPEPETPGSDAPGKRRRRGGSLATASTTNAEAAPSPGATRAMPGDRPGGRRWLLLVYRISSGSSTQRTYVWRQLRQLGAVYLQQAVAVLPDRPELRAGLDRLGQRIRSGGGEASMLETASPSEAWEEELIARFNATRDEEYEEVVENIERFEAEIRRETRVKHFLFPELEEGEGEWAKLRRWLARVVDRDFFHANGRSGAQEALARGQRSLDVFVREVYRAEGLDREAENGDR